MTAETSSARGWDGTPTWRKQKPTRAGVYGVRGFNFGVPASEQFEAIVAVRLYNDELVCNLHCSTSEDDFDDWSLVEDFNDEFEWCEFAATPPPPADAEPKTLPVPTRVYLTDKAAVIVGDPQRGWDEEGPEAHNCDAMGCASIGPHVLARVPFTDERALTAAQQQGLRIVEPIRNCATPESREAAMVVLETDAEGNPTIWCDPEIADLVRALNGGGVRTNASCSGHGEKPFGIVSLQDGRELLVLPDWETTRRAERILDAGLSAQQQGQAVEPAPPSAPVGAAEDMVLDAIERRESSAPVGVELSALRVQEWLQREYDIMPPVQEIEQAMRTPCSCPFTERALAQQPAAVDGAARRRDVRLWMRHNAGSYSTATELAEAADEVFNLPDGGLDNETHWVWDEAAEAVDDSQRGGLA